MTKNDWDTPEKRREIALEHIAGLLAAGTKPEALDASAQLALIREKTNRNRPERIKLLESYLDVLDELVNS